MLCERTHDDDVDTWPIEIDEHERTLQYCNLAFGSSHSAGSMLNRLLWILNLKSMGEKSAIFSAFAEQIRFRFHCRWADAT